MKSIRFVLRLLEAFFAKYRLILGITIIVAAAASVTVIYLSKNFAGASEQKIGVLGRYNVEELPISITRLLGRGLTQIGPDGKVLPDMATEWTTSDGGKTWVFKLRDDIFWQDGKRVDSDSINYRFSNARVEKPDQRTVKFILDSKFASFPAVVARPIFKKGLLGSGEYKAVNIKLNGEFVSELVLSNSQNGQKHFKFYPTEDRLILSFMLGQTDILSEVTEADLFDKWSTVRVAKNINENEVVAILLNTQDSLLSDKSLRQALNYAIDKNSLSGNRAVSPISQSSLYYNTQVKTYFYDPKKAKEMIADALSKKDKPALKISTTPNLLNMAEKIAKYWTDIGLESTVQVISGYPEDYQIYLTTFSLPDDPDQYLIWHSSQSDTNISRLNNARIDKLLEDGRTTIDFEERKKIYLDFQRFLVEESPAIFLYYPTYYTVERL